MKKHIIYTCLTFLGLALSNACSAVPSSDGFDADCSDGRCDVRCRPVSAVTLGAGEATTVEVGPVSYAEPLSLVGYASTKEGEAAEATIRFNGHEAINLDGEGFATEEVKLKSNTNGCARVAVKNEGAEALIVVSARMLPALRRIREALP